MNFKIMSCTECFGMTVRLDPTRTINSPVPGTGRLDCPHPVTEIIGWVRADVVVHAALSTVLRSVPSLGTQADMCHVLQEWLSVPNWYAERHGMPSRLLSDYGVSSEGVAVARIIAKSMGRLGSASAKDVLYWQAAVNVLRVRI